MAKNKTKEVLEYILNQFDNNSLSRDTLLDLIKNNGELDNMTTSKALHVKPIDTSNPLVEIKHVTKHYKGRPQPAINDISFNIYPGQFHAFIGANGAGKTTTIKSIIGAYSSKKIKGEILINGESNQLVSGKRLIGYIPEEARFPAKITTRDYLKLMTMLSGYSKKDAEAIVDNILKQLNIESLAHKYPDSFSSGQKKKILLSQALIHNPQILIMDEPAANLDPLARDELFNTLLTLQQQGKSIFISSHILDEIGKYATYATILDGGKVVYDGPVSNQISLSDLYKQYVKVGSVDTGLK